MKASTPTYNRAPSQELQALLSPDGFLAPLVELAEREVGGHHHDVHFRPKDEVHVYRGLTRLVTVQRTSHDGVNLTASSTYKCQPCAQDLLRRWRVDERGFSEELSRYLCNITVDSHWICGEGKVQERWSRVRVPWIPFDREGVLPGPLKKRKDFLQIGKAQGELTELYNLETKTGKRWGEPKVTGTELDQLAVDENGRLVLIELKDAKKRNAEVYYAPFQLLQYIWEWYSALEAVRSDLQALIDARVAVGLTPPDVPILTGGMRASVGFGADNRSLELKRRYGKVLEVVNRHLPNGMGPIETWEITDAGPCLAT